MAAPRAGAEDVEIEMPEQNHNHLPPQPSSLPPSINPSLNVSRADSDMAERGSARTEDMSDYGVDREATGMRYACPNINLGCGSPDKPVYSNPKYTTGGNVPGKKRYPTLDRPPSRAASQSTVHSTNQSTADLVGKKGGPAEPDSGALACCKSFMKDPKYDKLRIILLIVLLVIILLLIIILPIVLRKPSEPEVVPPEYEVVYAPLAVCGDLKLEGYKKDGVAEFRGIPYAIPPLIEKRWLASIPINAKNCETLTYTKADHFGHQCVQSQNPIKELESEDCLYLNVWTPTNHTAAAKLPVMVYFHDGDFRRGSGHDIGRYPLRKMVQEGQYILVSMNFRLQALGFMALEALPQTNVGLTDMLAALRWVQENIAGFGGDKTKVTAFGLGSGATSILALLNSKELTGLVHRAWLMSPGVVQNQPMLATKTGNVEFLTNIGCRLADVDSTKRCLYEKSAADILAAVPWNNGPRWAQPLKFDVPIKDNTTGPYIVTDALVGGVGTFEALTSQTLVNKQIPVIIGNADAEADIRPPSAYFGDGSTNQYLSTDQIKTNVSARLEAFDADIMTNIQNSYPNLETELGFTRLVGDIRALCPSNHIADHLHKMAVQVYRYIYEFNPSMKVSAFNHDFWASYTFHGIDMLAFFGALDGEAFSPYFSDSQSFATSFRSEIYKFIRGEELTWRPMPEYVSLTASATVSKQADTPVYPRNCAHWSSANMIPAQTWSN